jgi:hypothetical protein
MDPLTSALIVAAAASESPIICNLNALSKAEREEHSTDTKRLKAAVQRIEDVDGGYRWHLGPQVTAADLLRWVERERRCCSFLDFEIRLGRENGERWLQMTGRDGVKAFLAAEFKLTSAPGK